MKAFEKNENLDKKLSMFDKLINLIFLKTEKIYIKKFRVKNIQVWGKVEYERLTKN